MTDIPRIIDADTSRRRERFIVACILDQPQAKWGPNVSTAIAHAPNWWDSCEAGAIAAAIAKCVRSGRHPTQASVAEYAGKQWCHWVDSLFFSSSNALSLDIAEIEALDLVARYRGKRLTAVLGDAWQKARAHPEKAVDVARQLKKTLEEFCG